MFDFQKALKAALIFAGKNDIRYYLNGVQCKNDSLIATDGHRAIIIKTKLPKWAEGKIIDRSSVTQIVKLKSDSKFEFIAPDNLISFAKLYGIYPKFLDGKYPDIEKVIPKKEKHKSNHKNRLNMNYYMDAVKALIVLDDPNLINKHYPAEIDFLRYGKEEKAYFAGNGVEIVIMPIRL